MGGTQGGSGGRGEPPHRLPRERLNVDGARGTGEAADVAATEVVPAPVLVLVYVTSKRRLTPRAHAGRALLLLRYCRSR